MIPKLHDNQLKQRFKVSVLIGIGSCARLGGGGQNIVLDCHAGRGTSPSPLEMRVHRYNLVQHIGKF